MSHLTTTVPGNEHRGRLNRRYLLAGLAVVAASALVGCGSPGSASTSNDTSAATAVARVSTGMNGLAGAAQSVNNLTVVKMTGQNTFDAATITVPAGTTVTWLNDGTMPQSATFDPAQATNKADGALPQGTAPFDSGLVQPGQTWSHSFTTPGTYRYFCIPNEGQGMTGTVVVT
jgi:plastocyanin